MTPAGVSHRTMRARILRALENATPADVEAGDAWYRRARETSYDIAVESGLELRAAAGVIAAWSPRNQWIRNVSAARSTARGDHAGGLEASRAKAEAIARGADPLEVLSGRKTAAFYRNIIGDESAVTVDVWAARVAGVSEAALARRGAYDAVQRAYRAAARARGMTPARAQATAWIVIRGRAD